MTKDSASFTSTDAVISSYENSVNKRIADAVFKSQLSGEPISLSKEDLLYLKKRQTDDELQIQTPAPTITLKKGNTELVIPRAAELVHKMEELSQRDRNVDFSTPQQEDTNALIKEKIKAAYQIDPKKIVSETREKVWQEESTDIRQSTKSVNKNAYEIRLEVLQEAIKWMSLEPNMEVTRGPEHMGGLLVSKETYKNGDAVINLANKFYKFVENRR